MNQNATPTALGVLTGDVSVLLGLTGLNGSTFWYGGGAGTSAPLVSILRPVLGLPPALFTLRSLTATVAPPAFDKLEVLGLGGADSSRWRMDVATVLAMVAVRLCCAWWGCSCDGGGDQFPRDSAVNDVIDEIEDTVLPDERWWCEARVVGGEES